MADSAYDSSVSNFQSVNEAPRDKAVWDRARLDAELASLNRAFAATQSAAEEQHELAKALILRSLSEPMVDLAERFKKLDTIDLVDGLQTVLSHVIYGLKTVSKALHPDRAGAQTA
jgi:hypothetical protein